jgi:ADP-dependent NAD(P)H-hydrate dehydratase
MTVIQITRDLLRTMPLPTPDGGSKDERGRVLVVAGSREVPGAALLSGVAALRAGAGKLRIASGASVAVPLALAAPEALVMGLPETESGGLAVAGQKRLLACVPSSDGVLVGPGMTDEPATGELTAKMLQQAGDAGFVLDAAALVNLSKHPGETKGCGGRAVLTPHAGEMAQLLDRSRETVEADPMDAALTAARRFEAVVVMKGATTHIAEAGGQFWRYDGGCTGLGTSGSGDVLAGILVGLLARGAPPHEAACWGVYLHGEAGSRLAHRIGPLGFLARELSAEIPALLRETAGS